MRMINKAEYNNLINHCKTDRQVEILEAVYEHGSNNKAAKALGAGRRTIDEGIERIKKAANVYHSPGFNVKGKSTLFDGEGNVKVEWVKTERDHEKNELLVESIKDVFEDYKGLSKPIKSPKSCKKDLLTIYPMGDPHVGMFSWAEETGESFDVKIAEKNLNQAVDILIDDAPPSDTALILNTGDFFHSDSQANMTARAGNQLDVDSRWARVLQIGVQIMIRCTQKALTKHRKVIVKNVIGNHDEHTSQVLAVALNCFFHNNKRVEIDTSPSKFWYYKFGKNLFGATHGDTAKPDKLPGIMATDQPKWWGETEYRYWLTGHIHHDSEKEFPGCKWMAFRTLATKDAWHTAQGYRSQRDMQSITYHREYGEESRNRRSIARIQGMMK